MPSFDVVSEVDTQEVRNAVDQANRELSTRFDFKGTDSTVELKDTSIELESASEERLKAVVQVLEEVNLAVGINADKAREIGKFIKGLGLKGVQHQVQGEQLRITGKKRDDLQTAIAKLKENDFGVPLQFTNFRD
jgi:uncharacterized protein YajQ (UPF0234 family)